MNCKRCHKQMPAQLIDLKLGICPTCAAELLNKIFGEPKDVEAIPQNYIESDYEIDCTMRKIKESFIE